MLDVLIIGAGPGGYVAAIRAAQLGLKTAIIEEKHLGGICLNWGCIPTKALLRSAEVLRLARRGADYGLTIGEAKADLPAIIKRSRGVSDKLKAGVGFLLKKNKVTVHNGRARIMSSSVVELTTGDGKTERLQARHIIVATGARPRVLPGLVPDGKHIWTYFQALSPDITPKSLIIVGSGAIGVEFACFYAEIGTKVTLIEVADGILPIEDREIANFMHKQLEKQGIEILTGARLEKTAVVNGAVETEITSAKGTRKLVADRLLVAAGVVGNIESLGLEALGVKTDRGVITIDGFGRTNIAGIYAIGDVAGPPMLAHKAEHEGIVCAEAIAGLKPHPLDKALVPGCIYAHPQIASIGLTEEKAKTAGLKVRIGRFPFSANGKAIALGEDYGFIKTIFEEKTGKLLGAHLIGPEVTELLHGFVIAMNSETTEEELISTCFPHPTLSEAMLESTLDAFGRAIHI